MFGSWQPVLSRPGWHEDNHRPHAHVSTHWHCSFILIGNASWVFARVGENTCADRDQKCLSDGCGLLPKMPLPAMQGVFCWSREKSKCRSQSPGAGRWWASPGAARSLGCLGFAAGALCPALSLQSLGFLFTRLPTQHRHHPRWLPPAALPIPRLGTSLLEAAITCKKEEGGKTSTATIRIILLQPCQETDCKSCCI